MNFQKEEMNWKKLKIENVMGENLLKLVIKLKTHKT